MSHIPAVRVRVRLVTKYHKEMVALVRLDWGLQAHREYYEQYNRIIKDNIEALENFKGILTSIFSPTTSFKISAALSTGATLLCEYF